MQKILHREMNINASRQLAWGISLDAEGSILSIELITRQGLDEHTFLPVQVLSVPLQKEAAGFVLVHNHPPGQLHPTESDKTITARLIHCGAMLQMPLLDHLIIDGKSHYSFRGAGLMEKLEDSLKYGSPVSRSEAIGQDPENYHKEKDQLTRYIVSLMQEAGYPLEAIAARTGLSIPVILSLTNEEEEEEEIDPDSHYESATGNIKEG